MKTFFCTAAFIVLISALGISFAARNPLQAIHLNSESWTETVTVIPEQDPNGVLWGLRDRITHKLILKYTYQSIWGFKDGFALVQLNGQFGMIDKNGKEIIAPERDSPKTGIQCGYVAFEAGYGPVLIYDTSGKCILPMISGMTGFLPCEKRITYGYNRYGMVSFSGDTILPFRFTDAHLLPEGYCVAGIPDKKSFRLYGLYDLDGKEILPPVFEAISSFHCGRAIVKKNGKWGAINANGKEVFYTEYGRIDEFYNNYAVVYAHSNSVITIGIIDTNGHEVVPAIYQWLDYVFNFSEGLAAVAQNRKYGFADTTGKIVIPFRYDKVESFRDGIAKVWVGWKYAGYINTKGEEIIPPDFEAKDQANLRRFPGKIIIGEKDSVYHVFDYSGKEIAVLKYDAVYSFDENEKSLLVSKNNNWGVLDSSFRIGIPVEYESLENVYPGKIAARKNGIMGLINPAGKVITPFVYESINSFGEDGVALVSTEEKYGLMNTYGKLIIPVKYDEIADFRFGLAVVKRHDKYGYVNYAGKEIIPAIYDTAGAYNGYEAEVTLNGETFRIDNRGNRLPEED